MDEIGVLGEATAAYLKVLDGVTLATLAKKSNSRSGVPVKPIRLHAKGAHNA